MPKKEIKKRLSKSCSICGRKIRLICYHDGAYRGGHYFGKLIPYNKKYLEYWECPSCYWRIKPQEANLDAALKEVTQKKTFGPYHSAKELKKAFGA